MNSNQIALIVMIWCALSFAIQWPAHIKGPRTFMIDVIVFIGVLIIACMLFVELK